MRPVRTPFEQQAIDALIVELKTGGRVVEEDPAFTDRPDALLIVDGVRVAVECRIFSPEQLLQLHDPRKWQDEGLWQIVLPIEPHMWISQCINKKATRVTEYKERSNAHRAWLLCHFGTWLPVLTGEGYSEFVMEGVAAGIENSENKFDEIYVVDERASQNVACAYRNGLYQVPKTVRVAFPRTGLPTGIFFFGKIKPEIDADGRARITTNLQDPKGRILIQPLDRRFTLCEEDVAGLDFRNIGNGNNFPVLRLQRDRTIQPPVE